MPTVISLLPLSVQGAGGVPELLALSPPLVESARASCTRRRETRPHPAPLRTRPRTSRHTAVNAAGNAGPDRSLYPILQPNRGTFAHFSPVLTQNSQTQTRGGDYTSPVASLPQYLVFVPAHLARRGWLSRLAITVCGRAAPAVRAESAPPAARHSTPPPAACRPPPAARRPPSRARCVGPRTHAMGTGSASVGTQMHTS
jgi:hypothetical protein